MAKKCASLSASRSKAPVGWGTGHALSCCSGASTGTGCSRCSIDSASFCTYRFLAYKCSDEIVERVKGI
ncbi:hypothetical protein HAX54_027241, partial [Datura stramonium]|nr:hypothetical protein [Datura stramonium]